VVETFITSWTRQAQTAIIGCPALKRELPQMKELRADILSSMRDRVRDARYLVRALAALDTDESRNASGGRTPVDPRSLVRNVAKFSDAAMRRAETIATTLAPFAEPGSATLTDPKSYFEGRGDGAALFRKDVLTLFSSILPAVALANPLVHETRIALAHQVLEKHPAALALKTRTMTKTGTHDAATACALGAAIATELARAGAIILAPPVVGGLPKTQGELRAASFAYSVLGLAMAVSGLSGGTVPRAALTESVLVSAKARQTELTAALEAGDIDGLGAIYAKMAPHLP
jgi:hypothetical protein